MAEKARKESFGTLPDGREVEAINLSNRRGMRVRILTYGASIQSVLVPDREGATADVALGHATLTEYLERLSSTAPPQGSRGGFIAWAMRS